MIVLTGILKISLLALQRLGDNILGCRVKEQHWLLGLPALSQECAAKTVLIKMMATIFTTLPTAIATASV